MAIRGTFKLTGLDSYLEKIQKAGKDIVPAVKEAISESGKPILKDMIAGATPHIRTGKVIEALEISEVKQEGNYIYVDIGVNEEKAKEGAWVATFQEYGSPTFPKEPFIRPAFDNNQSNVKARQRSVLKRWGVPIK